MLKRALQLLTLTALVNLVFQLWPRTGGELIPVTDSKGKWGYLDDGGRVRIEFEWLNARNFDEHGIAFVYSRDGMGFIDERGDTLLTAEWQLIGEFNEFGMAQILDKRRRGFVNRKGEFVHELQNVEILSWWWPSLLVYNEDGLVILEKDRLIGVGDVNGDLIVPYAWKNMSHFGPQGVAPAAGDNGWVLINKKGEVVVDGPLEYGHIGPFNGSGLARVSREQSGPRPIGSGKDLSGWIDLNGELVIPVEWEAYGIFDQDSNFDDGGLVAVRKDGLWGWIDTSGEVVLPIKWQAVRPFDQRGHAIVYSNEKYGMINRAGEEVLPLIWDRLEPFDQNGYAKMQKDDPRWWGVVSLDGSIVVEPTWNEVGDMDELGYVRVKRGVKTGLVNDRGETVFLKKGHLGPYDQNGLAPFAEDKDAYNLGHYQGWVDRQGEFVIRNSEGWFAADYGARGGRYFIRSWRQISGPRKWIAWLNAWWAGEEFEPTEYDCRLLDKHGEIIWSSTWLRKKTKAWLYFFAALLPLLLVLWLGKRRNAKQTTTS